MIEHLITVLVAALVAYIIFYVVGLFIKDGTVMKIIGIVLGLLLLLYALNQFGFTDHVLR